jgi:hypothetical protein
VAHFSQVMQDTKSKTKLIFRAHKIFGVHAELWANNYFSHAEGAQKNISRMLIEH